MEMEPEIGPAAVGVKLTPIAQETLVANAAMQVLVVTAKSPLAVTDEKCAVSVPGFVTVIDRFASVVPITAGSKLTDAGTFSRGMTPLPERDTTSVPTEALSTMVRVDF